MESTPVDSGSASDPDALLSKMTQDDWENANTITKWLLKQEKESRPSVAQAIFDKLLGDASQSRQYHSSGQACVKLCSFVQQCAKSSDEALKRWSSTEALSLKLFHFYLEWYEHDPHRALRMVLDILVNSLSHNPCQEASRAIREHLVETLVLIITRKYPKLMIKSGLQCLDYLFTKRAILVSDLVRKYRQLSPSRSDSSNPPIWRTLTMHLFSWMDLSYVSPLIGKAIIHIFRGLSQVPNSTTLEVADFTVETWLGWVQDALVRSPGILEDVKNYVLVPVFKTDKPTALILLHYFNRADSRTDPEHQSTDLEFMLQLATLDLGKRFGLVEEPSNDTSIPPSSTHVVLRESILGSFLSHPSPSVRSSAFSLLVSSQATTKPFSQTAFDLLRRHLAALHTDYDAKFRNEMLGMSKSLVRRVKNIITVAQRSIAASENRNNSTTADPARPVPKRKPGPEATQNYEEGAMEILTRHKTFMKWYLDFLKWELLPTASYQRHITALKAILLALRIGKYAGAPDELDMEIIQVLSSDSSWARLLLDLLLDPFDDVRDSTLAVLALIPKDTVDAPLSSGESPANLLGALQEFCAKAKALADRTGRADHGDGAARSRGLLCRWLGGRGPRIDLVSDILSVLEVKISRAEADLGHAAIQNPVHGDFAAISYVWQVLATETYPKEELEKMHEIYSRVFVCFKRIWVAVKHVLCDDSPEGHLPEEMEEIEGLDTKDLLSYSFRAVHESSNLMRLMIGSLRLESAPGVPFPPLNIFRETGSLTFEQLASLRHRGAFSTVSLTFTSCCQLTQRLKNVYPDISGSDGLLREWYQGAVACIETQASTTRRSAGIPSLIAAILSANAESPSFGEVFAKLEEIGRKPARVVETDGSNLPQVHALNCLRGVFRNSFLSKKAENYLAVNLQLASNSLKSEIWAIRNCGLLLLRSLIDCLLGTGESKSTIESGWDGHSARISYNKYPTLPGVILKLLQSGVEAVDEVSSSVAEAVFPALDIIRRAGPPDEHRQELRGCIEGYLSSRKWHVREMAARTLCSFLLQTDWVSEISRLLSHCGQDSNRLHGILLTAKFTIERKLDLGVGAELDSAPLEALLREAAEKVTFSGSCPELQASFVEILNLLAVAEPSGLRDGPRGPSATLLADSFAAAQPGRYSALLDMQSALGRACCQSIAGDISGLRSSLLDVMEKDVNTAHRVLEALPGIWKSRQGSGSTPELCVLYADICIRASAPEIRAQSLLNSASLMDESLRRNDVKGLPSMELLTKAWTSLQEGDINPALSCAIIRASGTIIAAFVFHDGSDAAGQGGELRAWGALIANSLDIDNTFDTRHAAATALECFFLGSWKHSWNVAYLPAFSALYDALIDDDDEVRDAAASAAAGVMGAHLVPPTAADRLAEWLLEHFGDQSEFRQYLVYRMAGQTPQLDVKKGVQLVPAAELVYKAMDFDDSLFATEEQNLFIDEIKETLRWRAIFERLEGNEAQADPAFTELSRWAEAGLACLMQLAEKEDGPLGWTSDQHVFAACARIILCAVGVSKKNMSGAVTEMLASWKEGRNNMHSSLLEMAA